MPTRQPRRTTATPTQRLTPEEVEAHRRESVRRWNAVKRVVYSEHAPLCERCGATLLLCDCPPLGARVAQYRDVVLALNVATMTKRIEIL